MGVGFGANELPPRTPCALELAGTLPGVLTSA